MKYNIYFSIFIINSFLILTKCDDDFHEGECAEVGKKAKNFASCKGKKTYNPSDEYCCFLKAGKIQQCVEVLKKDIDGGNVKITKLEIEKGIYEYWEDIEITVDGQKEKEDRNYIYGSLNSFICDFGNYNKMRNILITFLIILLI